KNNKLFTLAQNSDTQCLWEVLRGMHQPLPVPSVALQQSSGSHLSSTSEMTKWKMNIESYPFLEFEEVSGGDSLNRKVLRAHFYKFPNSWIRPYCKGNIRWISNSFLQVSGTWQNTSSCGTDSASMHQAYYL
ncbi:hypothetical protein VIGAN_03099700, partial [Vigna angularis var. angularis]